MPERTLFTLLNTRSMDKIPIHIIDYILISDLILSYTFKDIICSCENDG